MTQKEAVRALGGIEALRLLESKWGLVPWDAKATKRHYSVASIQAAMDRAEREAALRLRARPETQSAAAE